MNTYKILKTNFIKPKSITKIYLTEEKKTGILETTQLADVVINLST